MHCNALQHIAIHFYTRQHPVTHCKTRQQTATLWITPETTPSSSIHRIPSRPRHSCCHCNTRQHPATPCNTLQHPATHLKLCQASEFIVLVVVLVIHAVTTTDCNRLQQTATDCKRLQKTTAQCNTHQHIEAHCNTPETTPNSWVHRPHSRLHHACRHLLLREAVSTLQDLYAATACALACPLPQPKRQ